jgi:hypothetical protein
MGTIVAAVYGSQKVENFNLYEIVDGQQRLTSLLILLSCIKVYLKDGDQKLELLELAFRKNQLERVFEADWDNNNIIKAILTISGKNNKIADRKYTNNSEKNAIDAWKEFSKWCKSHSNELPRYLNVILDRLGFIFFTPKHSKTLGVMFEVINNRGKPLSQLDKIKNYLLYYASVHDGKFEKLSSKITECWGGILSNLSESGLTGNQAEDNFVADCYFMFSDTNLQNRGKVYESLKAKYPVSESGDPKLDTLISFVDFLSDASISIRKLYTASSIASPVHDPINCVLENLRFHISRGIINPIFIISEALLKHKKMKDEVYLTLLSTLEVANFRLHELPSPKTRADSYIGTIISEARKYFHANSPYHHLFQTDEKYTVEGLLQWLEEYTISNRPINNFMIESLTLDIGEPYDYYSWNSGRYFLASYEQSLRHKKNPKQDFPLESLLGGDRKKKHTGANERTQIDHIWASDNVWGDKKKITDFGFTHQIRRLGNFMLLKESENKRVKNADVEVKLMSFGVLSGKEFLFDEREKIIKVCFKGANGRYLRQEMTLANSDKEFNLTQKLLTERTDTLSEWRSVTEIGELLKEGFYYHPKGKAMHATRRLMIYTRLFDLREQNMINWAVSRWCFPSEIEIVPDKIAINSFKGAGSKAVLIKKSGDRIFS